MDFSFQALRPGEVVIWNGEMDKRKCDAVKKSAPALSDEPKPNIRIREHVIDDRIVRSVRGKWGIEP